MATRKPVSLTPEMAEAVEDYRFLHRYKTESDAIRHLLELGLEAVKRAKPERKR
jgi:Arc/MetJ-type ribon-helix-helix transcriptional regulator